MNLSLIKNIWKDKKILCGFLFFTMLWLMIWGTYNTDIFRIFMPGFPHSTLDLIHGLRTFLPFIAIILAVIFLLKKRHLPKSFFLTPLGLLSIYTILGAVASVFSKNPLMALYWAVLYGSAIIVLLAVSLSSNSLKKLSLIVNINWAIAGIIAFGLLIFFLIQPGAISSLTANVLICSQRPYEGLGGVPFEIQTLGMAGTRPTGLGRYAGVMAIVAFVYFLYERKGKKLLKFVWFFLFTLFFLILLFSKGRTAIIGFIIAMIFVLCLGRKLNLPLIFGVGLIILLIGFTVFYNIPCTNPMGVVSPPASECVVPPPASKSVTSPPASECATAPSLSKSAANPPAPKSAPDILKLKNKLIFSTLSGRTTGVWLEAWQLFLSSPLLGYGFHADRIFLEGQHAHNALLHALIQTGLFGTIPFVLAFIITFVFLYRVLRTKNIEEKERPFLMGIAGVFVFFVVRGITESTGAFFGSDWLFLAPLLAYIGVLNQKKISLYDNSIYKPDKKEFEDGKKDISYIKVLGNKVHMVQIPEVVELINYWIEKEHQKYHQIIVTGMHGIMESYRNKDFKNIINSADLFVPDGISLVRVARLRGIRLEKRVCGTDLMLEFFKTANEKGYKSYFYGDTEGTLLELSKKMLLKFPKLKIAGHCSPPFRKLIPEEDEKIIEEINLTKPDILWVGLGLPKQEQWIFEHKEKLNVPVVIGVGAAFKFLSGGVKRAPSWIGDLGLEWLWRLFQEPQKTWKRVFIDGPVFVWLVLLELVGLKRYK